ncbi:uncharacterized protein LOC143214710 [Lasioglossum baleicum]|uniref:uncharacterized protein LOC143214710 n=1 Tax=Lasioglossum baleicum TaxID=434251 RepID=UPI003FCDAB38
MARDGNVRGNIWQPWSTAYLNVKLPEIMEKNINACKEISTEEPLTSICSDSYNTSSAVIKVETDDDSVGFTEPMSITGRKRRHLVNTDSHEVSEKVLKIESESKNERVGALLQSNKSTEATVSLVDKCTCISPRRLFNSPREQMLREQISKMKRRHQLALKALRRSNRRKDRKITDLQTILQTLKKKNLLEEEQVHSLSE